MPITIIESILLIQVSLEDTYTFENIFVAILMKDILTFKAVILVGPRKNIYR